MIAIACTKDSHTHGHLGHGFLERGHELAFKGTSRRDHRSSWDQVARGKFHGSQYNPFSQAQHSCRVLGSNSHGVGMVLCVLEVLETWFPEELVVGYGGQMASKPTPVGVAWSTPGLPCPALPAPVLLSLLAPWPAGSLPPSPASSEPSVSFLFLFCLENKGTPCCQGE